MVSKSNSAIIRRSSANHHSFRALIWYKAVLPKRGVSDMAIIQLEAIGSRGFSIIGNVGESAGWAVSSAGDVNGDGFDDLIIGAPYGDKPTTNAGSAYIVYGRAGGFANVDLKALTSSQGYVIQGNGYAGISVSGHGDINGDGLDDLVVATFHNSGFSQGTPETYVVFGKANRSANVDLANLATADGFKVSGPSESAYYRGFALTVANAGDVNGDGFDDVLIGAQYASGYKGAAYVVYGKASGFGAIDVTNLAPSAGFAIQGAATNDFMGFSVAAAGDVNGDGFDDVIVGAGGSDVGGQDAGQVFVIFGSAARPGTIDVANLPASSGFAIRGNSPNAGAGWTVSGAGDVNGDGYDDMIVRASGNAYVIFGKPSGFSTLNLNNLSAGDGFTVKSETNGLAGNFAAAGDVNHDGFADLIIGASSQSDTFTYYVMFGRPDLTGTINISALSTNLRAGFFLVAPTNTYGLKAGSAGDINHDGFADLMIAAPFTTVAGQSVGQIQIMLSSATLLGSHNDFNGDGRDDILWQKSNGTTTNWLAHADGSLTDNSANWISNAGAGWRIAATGDFNGDNRDDILWEKNGIVTNWLGQGNGSLADNSSHFFANPGVGWSVAAAGDFDGDGRDDILWQKAESIFTNWLGRADGSMADNSARFFASTGGGWSVAGVADFNGDSRDDILWQKFDGTTTNWLAQGQGALADNSGHFFANPGAGWHIAGTGDFNGDHRADILWRKDDGSITNWLGQADGNITDNSSHFAAIAAAGWHIMQIGDFNGDGRDDILWQKEDGTLMNWLGQVDGSFADNSPHFWSNAGQGWHVQPAEVFL
jgi:hypothetical protein